MKRLLYIIFIITSLTGFSQEKKGICSASCHLFHDNGGNFESNDHFTLNGFGLSQPLFYGTFQIDSTSWADSLIYEVILTFGDSLLYSASWHADGMCYPLSGPEAVDSIVTILEGTPFQIIRGGEFNIGYYSLYQKGAIKDPCLFKIQANYYAGEPSFIRVKFQDPPTPEVPLDLPDISKDIYIILTDENTLFIEADENSILNATIYSLSGQLIEKRTIEGQQNLNISSFPKGCYVVQVSDETGIEKRLKFVK